MLMVDHFGGCCGGCIIDGLNELAACRTPKSAKKVLMESLADFYDREGAENFTAVYATSVPSQRAGQRRLATLGFEKLHSFKSLGTGSTITTWVKVLTTAEKEEVIKLADELSGGAYGDPPYGF